MLIEIFFDALNFLIVAGLALAMRRDGFAHKRPMLTATIFIAVAGFGRWLGPPVEKAMGEGPLSYFLQNYSLDAALIIALALYDLATRRRLHRVVVLATLLGLVNQTIVSLKERDQWNRVDFDKRIARRLPTKNGNSSDAPLCVGKRRA